MIADVSPCVPTGYAAFSADGFEPKSVSARAVNVALLGCGTVGSAVARLMIESRARLIGEYGIDFRLDRALVRATQGGLPLVPRPYDVVGAQLGVSGEVVRERLAAMMRDGLVRRIGAVPNHYRLGFVANGMTVWDVDDAQVDTLGAKVGVLSFVSHCYRRPRILPAKSRIVSIE